MALKDLVADHRKIAEETVEKIVAPYIRYDPAAYKIVWTPAGKTLGNDAKILVFLVAVLGWQYILEEQRDVPTRPADLEDELGIPGGTLRPTLKKLKDSHLLTVVDGNYRVQFANFDAIEAVISGERPKIVPKIRTKKQSRATNGSDEPETLDDGEVRKKTRGNSNQLKTLLTEWISDGFFNEPKTLANLLDRYHEHGIITKRTSLSGLLLGAVRGKLLARTKTESSGKQVWAYKSKGS